MFKKIRIIATLLTISVLIGCNENKKDTEQKEIEVNTETVTKKIQIPKNKKERTENISKTNTGLEGVWVNKKYVDKLLSTKSPKKSQDVTPISMVILPKQVNQDATLIWGFHEGSNGKVIKKKDAFEIKSEEIGDPSIPLKVEKDGIKIKNDAFVKLKYGGKNTDFKLAEQLLFAGKYNLDGKQVEFTPTGKVIGLDSFSYYSVLIDYYDAGMQVDQIKLGKSEKNSKNYGFNFRNNKLIIYELKCIEGSDDYCDVVKLGKRLYKLKKTE